MENNRQICRHSRTKHIDEHDALLKSSWSTSLSVEASSLVNDGRGEEDVIPLQPLPNGQHGEEDVIPLQPPPESSVMDAEQPFRKVSVVDADLSYFNDNSRRFFKSDLVGQGTSVLVARSQSRVDEICSCDYLHDYEVKYHMDIAKIVSFLPIRHVELLSSIIRQTIDIEKKKSNPPKITSGASENNKLFTKIPDSIQLMRRYYLDDKYGILRSLPRPSVITVSGHGYVSLRACIADILAHGACLDVITRGTAGSAPPTTIRAMSESKRAQSIYDNASNVYGSSTMPDLLLYYNEWMDDFEPLYSSKSNRGSTWFKTVTICPPANGGIHRLTHTYPIACGRKGCSHEVVEQMFASEMASLRCNSSQNIFYSKKHGGNVRVYAELFAGLQDQPERRSGNYIMLGGGRYTARWGHAADFVALASGIPSCKECAMHLLSVAAVSDIRCTKCLNWEIRAASGLLDFKPPKEYPADELPEENYLRPKLITYGTLMDAVVKCHDKVVAGVWSIENANAFLWVNGINTEAKKEIIQNATNELRYNTLFDLRHSKKKEYESISRQRASNPSNFKRWEFPALWTRGTELTQHVDVIMHLIFLGVIRATIKRIEEWMRSRGKYDGFVKSVGGTLESLQLLSLSWCKALPYTKGSFGGWVSENYLAIARVLPWFYMCLPNVADKRQPYVEPLGPYKKWTVRQNKFWLSHRNLPIAGKAKVLKERVALCMTQEGGPPPVAPPASGTVAQVMAVVQSLWSMVSILMAKEATETNILKADRSIKCFLNAFDVFDKNVPRKKTKKNQDTVPTWITSYNFICLLNLPGVMRTYGPLPNLWEGGGQGEKVLSRVKPLHNGYRKGWQEHLLKNVLDCMTLDRIVGSSDPLQEGEDKDYNASQGDAVSSLLEGRVAVKDVKADYKRYQTLREIQIAFRRGKPVSVVELVDQRDIFWASLSDGTLVSIFASDGAAASEDISGLRYFTMTMVTGATMRKDSDLICRYCVMLPRRRAGVMDDGSVAGCPQSLALNREYAIIDSRWNAYFGTTEQFKRPSMFSTYR
jgi:hypothetical protein